MLRKFSFLFLSVLFISFIFITNVSAADPKAPSCITALPPRWGSGVIADNGVMIASPQWVSYDIDPTAGPSGAVVIEVKMGGRYDNGRELYLNISDFTPLDFYVDREILPLYITCHDSRVVAATDGSIGWQKERLIQSLAVGKGRGYQSPEIPEDRSSYAMLGIEEELHNIEPGLDNLDSVLDKSEISTLYEYRSASEDDILKWIGYVLILLGAFFGIKEIVNIWR